MNDSWKSSVQKSNEQPQHPAEPIVTIRCPSCELSVEAIFDDFEIASKRFRHKWGDCVVSNATLREGGYFD